LVWTIGMGVSLVLSLAMLRELLIDVYAITQSDRPAIAMFRLYTEGEVWVVVLCTVALAAFFAAAMVSYLGQALLTLPLLLVGGLSVVVIPFYLHLRRLRVFRAVKLRKRP
jgi:hypothetical protein